MLFDFFVLVCVTGDRESDIIAVFLVKDECITTISHIFTFFNIWNSFTKTSFFVSDKDSSERTTMAKFFEDSHLLLCIHHVYEAINFAFKKGTYTVIFTYSWYTEKLSDVGTFKKLIKNNTIPSQLKTKLNKTEGIREFTKIVPLFEATSVDKIKRIMKIFNQKIFIYLNRNWFATISQWVPLLFTKRMHLGLTANNRVECIFSKMNPYTADCKNFLEFFNHFISYIIIRRKFITYKIKRNYFKKKQIPNHLLDT